MASATGLPAVADDTGLEVDALGGRPGVHAARYAGKQATYEDNCRKLLQELHGVPKARRSARFVTVAAIALPGGEVQISQGVLEGLITEAASWISRIRLRSCVSRAGAWQDLGRTDGATKKPYQPSC